MIKKQFEKLVKVSSIVGNSAGGEFLQVRIVGGKHKDLKGIFLNFLEYTYQNLPYSQQLETILGSEVVFEERLSEEDADIYTILYYKENDNNTPSYAKICSTISNPTSYTNMTNALRKVNVEIAGRMFRSYAHPIGFETNCPSLIDGDKDVSIEMCCVNSFGQSSGGYYLIVPQENGENEAKLWRRMMRLDEMKAGQLSIKAIMKTGKKLLRTGLTHIKYIISDNVLELLNNRIPGELLLIEFEHVSSCFVGAYKDDWSSAGGSIEWSRFRGKDIKYEFYNGILIGYDGEVAKNEVLQHVDNAWLSKTHYLTISQYNYRTQEFYNRRGSNVGKGAIFFIPKNKIRIYPEQYNNGTNMFQLSITYNDKNRRPYENELQIFVQSRGNTMGYAFYWVIPYDGSGNEGEYLNLLTRCIHSMNDYGHCDVSLYKDLFLGEAARNDLAEEDILEEWFKSTLTRTKEEKDNVIRAYLNMKRERMAEIKQFKEYIDSYDFSKLNPVPVVKADKKTLKNYYKTLHIQPENYIIEKINNKKIKTISKNKGTVKVMLVSHEMVLNGKKDLNDFYDRQTNTISFRYSDLKGAIKR